jgi:hypothetical protein
MRSPSNQYLETVYHCIFTGSVDMGKWGLEVAKYIHIFVMELYKCRPICSNITTVSQSIFMLRTVILRPSCYTTFLSKISGIIIGL